MDYSLSYNVNYFYINIGASIIKRKCQNENNHKSKESTTFIVYCIRDQHKMKKMQLNVVIN